MSLPLTLVQPSSAQSSAPQAEPLYLHRAGALQALVDLATFNPSIGRGVEHLTISIPPGPGGVLAQTVHRALRLTPNLQSLVLNLSPTVADPTLLVGLSFPRLEKFSTNLPHHVLVPFLHANPTLNVLILRVCQCIVCPLRAIGFNHLNSLHCSSRCFMTGIVYAPLPRTHLLLGPLTAHFNQQLASSRLQTLVIDFFPTERNILARIATAVPTIRKLKLNEKPRPQQHAAGTVQRPWDDLPEWHRSLMRMSFLEEFMLRTSVSLSTRRRSELSVVFGWVNGSVRRSMGHPSIFHIGIIQKDWTNGQQRLSHWIKMGRGEWECDSSHMVGPNHSFVA